MGFEPDFDGKTDPLFFDFGGLYFVWDRLNSAGLVWDRRCYGRSTSQCSQQQRDGSGDHEAAKIAGKACSPSWIRRSLGCLVCRSQAHGDFGVGEHSRRWLVGRW